MYGEVPYSFATYPVGEIDRRLGRDPYTESLPSSAPEAQYESTFGSKNCAICGRVKTNKKGCAHCSKLLEDRFGKRVEDVPKGAARRMWWTAIEEKEAKAAGKSDADIKLDRLRQRREVREEKRKLRKRPKQVPALKEALDDLYVVGDHESYRYGTLNRPIADPEVRQVAEQIDREQRQWRTQKHGEKAKRPTRTGMMRLAGGDRFPSSREMKVDSDLRKAEARLARIEGNLSRMQPGTRKHTSETRKLGSARKRIAELEEQRANLQDKATGKISDYVEKNRSRLVRRYWNKMAPDEQEDVSREILEGKQDPFVTHMLAAYAARDINSQAMRESQRLYSPPVRFRQSKSRPF